MAARAETIVDLKQAGGTRRRNERSIQAVRDGRTGKPRPAPVKRRWRRWVALALLLCAAGGVGSWGLKYYAASFTVQHVEIQGEFHNQQAHDIKRALLPYVKGDFFTVDLTAARRSVTALPWVRRASLRRQWPNRIQVRIDEQVPVARWHDNAFINSAGEVFSRAFGVDPDRLPFLSGPQERSVEVRRRLAELQSLAGEYGASVEALHLDQRDSWTLQLARGPAVRLGGESLEARLRRFFEVVTADQALALTDVDSVDLRYSNGFAVEWKTGRGPDETIDPKEVQ